MNSYSCLSLNHVAAIVSSAMLDDYLTNRFGFDGFPGISPVPVGEHIQVTLTLPNDAGRFVSFNVDKKTVMKEYSLLERTKEVSSEFYKEVVKALVELESTRWEVVGND